MTSQLNIVLVHGAWMGGWSWKRVVEILRMRGHQVSAPTLTGVGEGSHLLTDKITLATHVDDIANHLIWENLDCVVLVGHSYGGMPITGVADRLKGRLKALIYLDAGIARSDRTLFEDFPEDVVKARMKAAKESSGGLSLPPPSLDHFAISDPADIDFIGGRLTPHPIRTYQTSVKFSAPVGNNLPASFITCTEPPYPATAPYPDQARELGWRVVELACGHLAMITNSEATANLIERLGA